jgi:uncharacterized membrane protein
MVEAQVSTAPVSSTAPLPRLDFIDALRGLVIALMVLDHTRDFVNRQAFLFDPLDLDKTSVALFLTRWVTHLCAPTFVLLSGVSIFLQAHRGKTGWPLSRFLLTRGLWLMFLEVTVVDLGFDFRPAIFLQVIYAIGLSMVLMAAAVQMPRRAVLGLGIILVAGHNLFDSVDAATLGAWGLPWHLLMQPGPLPFGFIAYPVLPWFGIMCVGYGMGGVYLMEPSRRSRTLAWLSIGAILLFFVLRLPNFYGDPRPWTVPADPSLTPLAIMSVAKYPPSLDYVLITLGISTLLGLALGRAPAWLLKPFLAFGRTPMLSYLLHLYIAHTFAVMIAQFYGVPAMHFIGTLSDQSRLRADGWGLSLAGTYGVWLAVLAVLYPLANRYARYRATHKSWWLSYL